MPTLVELDHLMLRPSRAVPGIAQLGDGTVAMAATNQPWRMVGRDAVVYQLRRPDGTLRALRCPIAHTNEPALADRYGILSSSPLLNRLSRSGSSLLVGDIQYLAEGIQQTTESFRSVYSPLIGMGWAAGTTLLATADRAAKIGRRADLVRLANTWLAASRTLREAHITHGDLTGDNLLVRANGSMVLVDYDTLLWPGGPEPDGGGRTRVSAYRHPSGRSPQDPGQLDDFAALVIATSLMALAERPDLRAFAGEATTVPDGGLLFTTRDLTDPARSRVFNELRTLREPATLRLVEALRDSCVSAVDTVPDFGQLVAAERRVRKGRASATETRKPVEQDQSGTEREALRERSRQERLTQLNSLLLNGDDLAALTFWQTSGLAEEPEAVWTFGPIMAELERQLETGEVRKVSRDEAATSWPTDEGTPHRRIETEPAPWEDASLVVLRHALDAQDAQTVARLWPQLKDDPGASVFAFRVADLLATAADRAISLALRGHDDRALEEAIREAESLGVPITGQARQQARAARSRLRTRAELEQALSEDDRATLANLAVSGRLDELGTLRPEVERAIARAVRWPQLRRALAGDDDRVFRAIDNLDLFRDDPALSVEDRARLELALRRGKWQERVRFAIRERDDQTLRELLERQPPGAFDQLSEVEQRRVKRLMEQRDAIEHLERAVADADGNALLDALGRTQQIGSVLPDDLDWGRVRRLLDEAALETAMRKAVATDPPDYLRLARIRSIARTMGSDLVDHPALQLDSVDVEVLRQASIKRLKEALASEDNRAIVAAAEPDPYGAIASLDAEQRQRVARALASIDPVFPLLPT